MKSLIFIRALAFSAACLAFASCTFSVSPVWNSNKSAATPETKATPNLIQGRDDLKAKAIQEVETLHKLMNAGKYEEAYDMIDDESPLKMPRDQALENMKELSALGKFQKMEMTRDIVVEDKSLRGGQLQIRQEFIVTYEKDTPTPKRYELFNWNVYPGDRLKLWGYINSKGDE
jgi:hypothetical protein